VTTKSSQVILREFQSVRANSYSTSFSLHKRAPIFISFQFYIWECSLWICYSLLTLDASSHNEYATRAHNFPIYENLYFFIYKKELKGYIYVTNSRCVVLTNSENLQKQGTICFQICTTEKQLFKAAAEKLNPFSSASAFWKQKQV
jgi:hypothetical protein